MGTEKTIKRGIMSALLTPFNSDGSVRASAIKEMVDYEIERGAKGFYVNGSTGEGIVMNEEERMQVAEETVKAAGGRAQVIIHVGAADTGSAVRMAKHAERVGADGVSSVTPFYYHHNMRFILDYFKDIAASVKIPFIVYQFGEGTVLGYDEIMELFTYDNIAGLKYTVDNLEILFRIKDSRPDKLVFMGHDAMCLPALVTGADGEIGAFPNVMPDGFDRIWNMFSSGDLAGAMEEQRQIDRYICAIKKHTKSSLQAALKVVFGKLGVDCGTNVRRPAQPLDEDEAAALIRELETLGFFERFK